MSTLQQGVAILIWSADLSSPERLATPFVMAQAGLALDQSVELYFTARSVQLLTRQAANISIGFGQTSRTLREYLLETHSLGARLYACSQAMHAAEISQRDLIKECAGLGGAVQFMSRTCDPSWRTLVF